jgi:hypothetical protein
VPRLGLEGRNVNVLTSKCVLVLGRWDGKGFLLPAIEGASPAPGNPDTKSFLFWMPWGQVQVLSQHSCGPWTNDPILPNLSSLISKMDAHGNTGHLSNT